MHTADWQIGEMPGAEAPSFFWLFTGLKPGASTMFLIFERFRGIYLC